MAKGYLIGMLDVRDADAYAPYRDQVPAIIERHGGRYLARGGALDAVEGQAPFTRLVIVEFPSMEAVHTFYRSDEYQRIISHRTNNAAGMVMIAEGISPPDGEGVA